MILLEEPNAKDPLNDEAGRMFLKNRKKFNEEAKKYGLESDLAIN